MKKNQIIILYFLAVTFLVSCKKTIDNNSYLDLNFSRGVLISNEGKFPNGTGTITFFDRGNHEIIQDLFQRQNGYPAGSIVNSVEVHNGKAYIVVNNAGKIEVVNNKNFESTGTITGLMQPRYFLGINDGKGYVTQWGNGSQGEIKVVDLASNTILKTIVTGAGSERMIRIGQYVYVCNAGGYDAAFNPVNDSTVAIIDTDTDSLVTRLNVGYNPSSIFYDSFGKLWIACYGISDWTNPSNNKNGSLVRLNPSSNSMELQLDLGYADSFFRMTINGNRNKLFYTTNGNTFSMNVTDIDLPAAPLISRGFYSLGFDPVSNYLFAGDARDFQSNGYVFRYQQDGTFIDSLPVGIIPGNYYFQP